MSRSLIAARVDPDGRIADANRGFAEGVGLGPREWTGRPIQDFLASDGWSRLEALLGQGDRREPVLISLLDRHGHPFSIHATAIPDPAGGFVLAGEVSPGEARSLSEHLQRLNNELATLAREHARQERTYRTLSRELQATLDELDRSYWHLKKIQQAVPICMECSRLKGGESEWRTLTEYLRENEIFLSHGYCPSCAESLLEELGLG